MDGISRLVAATDTNGQYSDPETARVIYLLSGGLVLMAVALAGVAELFKGAGDPPPGSKRNTKRSEIDDLLTPPEPPNITVDVHEDAEADIARTEAAIENLGVKARSKAGWYPDPEQPSKMRWWDGSAWADPGD